MGKLFINQTKVTRGERQGGTLLKPLLSVSMALILGCGLAANALGWAPGGVE